MQAIPILLQTLQFLLVTLALTKNNGSLLQKLISPVPDLIRVNT